jgi:hypothetical protein
VLIGKQVYYDGCSGEFHTFALPPRRQTCLSCGIDNDPSPVISHSATTAPSLGLPFIPEDNRISSSHYLEVLQSGASHVLLDVRSQLQFDMISLPLEKYSPNVTALRYLNTPFATLSSSSQAAATLEIIASAA